MRQNDLICIAIGSSSPTAKTVHWAVLVRRGSGALSHSVMGFAVSGSRSRPPAAALAIPAPEVGGYAVAVRDGIVPPAIMKEIRRPWSCLEMLVA